MRAEEKTEGKKKAAMISPQGGEPIEQPLFLNRSESAAHVRGVCVEKSSNQTVWNPQANTRKRPSKLLVVDDIMDTLQILSAVLERDGYLVITARDGVEAIQRAEQEGPALILLDLMIPKKNGFEVCRTLKENPNTREIPILMISAKVDPSSREEGLALGASEYLFKPLNLKDIVAKVKAYLSSKAVASRSF